MFSSRRLGSIILWLKQFRASPKCLVQLPQLQLAKHRLIESWTILCQSTVPYIVVFSSSDTQNSHNGFTRSFVASSGLHRLRCQNTDRPVPRVRRMLLGPWKVGFLTSFTEHWRAKLPFNWVLMLLNVRLHVILSHATSEEAHYAILQPPSSEYLP